MSTYRLGYARVSTTQQDEALQLDALNKAGCDRLFIDKASGKLESRLALDDLLEQARPGARGRTGGRPTVWTADKLRTAQAMRGSGDYDVAGIAKVLGVSRASVYRALSLPPTGAA